MDNDPNGYDWPHEAKCRRCKRRDSLCTCDWPMPAGAPTTPPDDEALLLPNPPESLPAECPPGFRIPEKRDAE